MVLICALYRPLLCQPCQLTTPHSQLPSKLSGFVNNWCPAQVKTLGGTMTSGRTLMGVGRQVRSRYVCESTESVWLRLVSS